jgi:hypothetical protein
MKNSLVLLVFCFQIVVGLPECRFEDNVNQLCGCLSGKLGGNLTRCYSQLPPATFGLPYKYFLHSNSTWICTAPYIPDQDRSAGCQDGSTQSAWTHKSTSQYNVFTASNFIDGWTGPFQGMCNPSGIVDKNVYYATTAPQCCMHGRFCAECGRFTLDTATCKSCLDGQPAIDGVCGEPRCELAVDRLDDAACAPPNLRLPLSSTRAVCAQLSALPTLDNQLVNVTRWHAVAPIDDAMPTSGERLSLTTLNLNFTGTFRATLVERSSSSDLLIALTLRHTTTNAGVLAWLLTDCASTVVFEQIRADIALNDDGTSQVPATIYTAPRAASMASRPLPQCSIDAAPPIGCFCVDDDGASRCRTRSQNNFDLTYDDVTFGRPTIVSIGTTMRYDYCMTADALPSGYEPRQIDDCRDVLGFCGVENASPCCARPNCAACSSFVACSRCTADSMLIDGDCVPSSPTTSTLISTTATATSISTSTTSSHTTTVIYILNDHPPSPLIPACFLLVTSASQRLASRNIFSNDARKQVRLCRFFRVHPPLDTTIQTQ